MQAWSVFSSDRLQTQVLQERNSGKSKVLVFFRVWSFNMHAPYILSAHDLGDLFGIL